MKKIMLSILLLLFVITSGMAQDNSSYRTSLKKMMEVSGAIQSYKGAIDQFIKMFKERQSNIPNEVWDEMTVELNKIGIEDLVTMTLPVYQRHLTEADIKAIIAFYETPAGKKFAEKTPMITKESMQAGQEWGKKIGEAIGEKLKAKGYLKTL
jgi:hypothetical protein